MAIRVADRGHLWRCPVSIPETANSGPTAGRTHCWFVIKYKDHLVTPPPRSFSGPFLHPLMRYSTRANLHHLMGTSKNSDLRDFVRI